MIAGAETACLHGLLFQDADPSWTEGIVDRSTLSFLDRIDQRIAMKRANFRIKLKKNGLECMQNS
jgi:hypothetical protein